MDASTEGTALVPDDDQTDTEPEPMTDLEAMRRLASGYFLGYGSTRPMPLRFRAGDHGA